MNADPRASVLLERVADSRSAGRAPLGRPRSGQQAVSIDNRHRTYRH